jgi:hypothetical protein
MNSNKETRLSGQTERAEQSTDSQAINEVVGEPFFARNPAAAHILNEPKRLPEADRYCKRCSKHRKDVGGKLLNDAQRRSFWVCQYCCSSYDARNSNSTATANKAAAQKDTSPSETNAMKDSQFICSPAWLPLDKEFAVMFCKEINLPPTLAHESVTDMIFQPHSPQGKEWTWLRHRKVEYLRAQFNLGITDGGRNWLENEAPPLPPV